MIIWTSSGLRSLFMREKFEEVIPDKSGTMLIIPLAGMTCKITGRAEKQAAVDFGFREENISVFMDSSPEEFLHQQFDVIYVPGGNTFKLLHDVRNYHLDTLILENYQRGALYIGVSAGAYLVCPDIAYVKQLGDENHHIQDENYSALHLTEKFPLCHYDMRGLPYYRLCRELLGESAEIITIDNDDLKILSD